MNNHVYISRLRCVGTEDDKQMPRLEDKMAVEQDFLSSYKIDVTTASSSTAARLLGNIGV